ncbi:hypothetical protein Tco_1480507, partial [Tanacetum coccineum]
METECELMEPGFELIAWKRVEMETFSFVRTTLEAKKTWWLRLGAGVYDSWKIQGDVEELWDELAKLGLGACKQLGDELGESWRSVVACLQALSNLHYLLSGFMDYFWSCKLNISNFGPANRKILPM